MVFGQCILHIWNAVYVFPKFERACQKQPNANKTKFEATYSSPQNNLRVNFIAFGESETNPYVLLFFFYLFGHKLVNIF